MKRILIILLFIPLYSWAQFRVDVTVNTSSGGKLYYSDEFSTPAGAEHWAGGLKSAWGKSADVAWIISDVTTARQAEDSALQERKERILRAKEKIGLWKKESIDNLGTNSSIKAFLKDILPEIIELLREE